MNETWISPQQLSERWGVSTKTLANQRSLGLGLPFHHMGRAVRYALSDIEAHERASRVEPVQ
ncbi:hypothetical protein GCM10028801_30250 [Nocardioides maradonensis]